MALCLSGGGFRAMLFHVGVLWRLNNAQILGRINFFSSVSGGSITAGVLGCQWDALGLSAAVPGVPADQFIKRVVKPLREFASRTIDIPAGVKGLLFSGGAAKFVARAYDKWLFHGATLRDLPKGERQPRFIINASNLMSAALWRFSQPYMADWRVGRVEEPEILLAAAVAASSAFPPFLSPMLLPLPAGKMQSQPGGDLHYPPYTEWALLTDGGVYDNLGLESVYKRCRLLLVSDAGQKIAPEKSPYWNWLCHLLRVMNLMDDQVRSQRKRNLMAAYLRPGLEGRTGAYWSIRSTFAELAHGEPLADPLGVADFDPRPLAEVRTRLGRIKPRRQERLINWGYAVCDAALRRWTREELAAEGIKLENPPGLPYPASVLRS